MPTAPLRVCAHAGCHALVRDGYCPTHARPAWTSQHGAVPRIRGRQLQRMRQRLFHEQPLCAMCLAHGRVTLATIRDHVVPLAEGGPDDETNQQPLCQGCSDAKTAEERRRGIKRWWER